MIKQFVPTLHVMLNKEVTFYTRFIYRDLYTSRNTDRVKQRPHPGSDVNHTRQLKNANFKNMFARPVHARTETREKQTKKINYFCIPPFFPVAGRRTSHKSQKDKHKKIV